MNSEIVQAPKKAIIFARVSTTRQEKEGLSLNEIQLPRAHAYAEKHGFQVVREFAIGETGGQYKIRAKFNEMLDYIKKHKEITEIISFRVDRITRNFHDAVAIDDLRMTYSKNIHLIDDNLILTKDSSSGDLLQWDMKVLFARQYLERVREDGNNTKINKLTRGELPWCAPYGYEHKTISMSPKIKSVVPKEPEATIVKTIHQRYSTGAYSVNTLTKCIYREFNTYIPRSNVHRILRERFYIGYMYDKKNQKEYQHFYEQLVPEEIFNINQELLSGHKKQRVRYGGIPAIYRGLIKCAECGCSITPDPKNRKLRNGDTRYHMYYHCSNGKHVHQRLTNITEEEISQAIEVGILDKLSIPEEEYKKLKLELNEAHTSKNAFYEERRKTLLARRSQLSNRQKKAYDMLMDGCITPEQYNENNERYAEELNMLQRQESQLDSADQNFYVTVGYLLELFKNAKTLYARANTDEKREILKLLLSNIELDGKNIIFTLKKPFDTLVSISNGSLWLGMRDSNPRMVGPEPTALPLGDAPSAVYIILLLCLHFKRVLI